MGNVNGACSLNDLKMADQSQIHFYLYMRNVKSVLAHIFFCAHVCAFVSLVFIKGAASIYQPIAITSN